MLGEGSFRHAPELVEGTIDAHIPIVVADDFNGDGRADLAVFDAGVYVVEQSSGYGNPPQLFLTGRPASPVGSAGGRRQARARATAESRLLRARRPPS